MRHYEIVVMVGAEQRERGSAVAQRYQGMVAEGGGAVHRFEDWGSRRLAYPIGRRTRARYFLFNIECDSPTLDKLRDDFRYSESVIRSLVVRRDRAIVGDSPIMTQMKEDTAREEAKEAEKEAVRAAAAAAPAAAPVAAPVAAPAAEEKDSSKEDSNEEKE